MDMRAKINEFTAFVLSDDGDEDVPQLVPQLVRHLDELAVLIHNCEAAPDATNFPDSPPRNAQAIRSQAETRFPSLGFYDAVDVTANVGESNDIMIGDAIDDIMDIAGDLLEVEWRFANTSIVDAQWYFAFSFQHHWGRHLRDLQCYLHRLDSKK